MRRVARGAASSKVTDIYTRLYLDVYSINRSLIEATVCVSALPSLGCVPIQLLSESTLKFIIAGIEPHFDRKISFRIIEKSFRNPGDKNNETENIIAR